jgi:CD2 antigen cytoplasmic tail-binding protein 2
MSSRHSAARPRRGGENFARTHHRTDEDDGPESKKLKFDVRNPSALAPDAPDEEDLVLEADVIGRGGAAAKRGAVNIDGYDSDSDNDNIDARAEERHRKKKNENVDLIKQMDNYTARGEANGKSKAADDDDDDDEDMFAADDDDNEDDATAGAKPISEKKRAKEVRFLENDKIQGQEMASRSGGHVRLDEESSDEEEDKEEAIAEEGLDEEVGAGGLKRNAPKVEAFNMKAEQEEGRFDQDGNFIRKAVDPDAVHDRWLEGVSKKDMKKAAAAHEKREADARKLRMEEDSILTTDLLRDLALRLERGETSLEALARLGKIQAKNKPKKIPKWKLKKQKNGADNMDLDNTRDKPPEDPEQTRISEAIAAITDAADKLLSRDRPEIYDQERELLVREWSRETGEEWVEPQKEEQEDEDERATSVASGSGGSKMWEFRWTDGRDGAKQGPFDEAMMKSWQLAGYFGEGVEFRPAGEEDWSRVAAFV